MKGLIKKSLVIVAMFLLTITFAIGEKEPVKVSFDKVKKGSVLTIKDVNNLVLYKEVIKFEGAYSKGFDLTALPDGVYYFELSKDIMVETIPFSVFNNEVIFDKSKMERFYKPVVFVNNDRVHVSKFSPNKEEALKVKIYYEGHEMIFDDAIEKEGYTYGKIYDFGTSRKGNYTVVVYTNGQRFVEHVQL